MQSQQHAWHSACKARNAYNPVLALRAAFRTSARSLHDDDNSSPFPWEIGWLPNNRKDESDNSVIKEETESPVRRVITVGDTRRFATHDSWKTHMAKIREESLKIGAAGDKPGSLLSERVKRFMDYKPAIVNMDRRSSLPQMPEPWLGKDVFLEHGKVSPASRFSSDISRFSAWLAPTPSEQRARTAVVQETMELIENALPYTTRAELFGSETNGLALPLSDLDFRIWNPEDPGLPPSRLVGRLRKLCTVMHASDSWRLVSVRAGPYPILNAQHKESGIDLQIVASHDSKPQEEIVRKYIHEIPCLKDVYNVIRTALSMRGLLEVFSGGLGSYGTFIMVLAALQREVNYKDASAQQAVQSLPSRKLMAFLDFYCELDMHKYGVAVHPRTLFKKHEASAALKAYSSLAKIREDPVRAGQWDICVKRPAQPYLLCLQDPANPHNDLGKKGHAIKHIIATFDDINKTINQKYVESLDTRRRKPNLLPILVGRCHQTYYERRRMLEEYGTKVSAASPSQESQSSTMQTSAPPPRTYIA